MNAAYETVETVARTSYGRLVAYLASRSGDVAGAEDALSEALYKALIHWPSQGIPTRPEAWLLQTARNHAMDEARKRKVRQEAMPALWQAAQEAQTAMEQDLFPDDRLKLLFVCAHPAIDPAVRTPLLLQTVLGFDAARIASAFLVAPAAMGQRLVRAKTKIREAGIAFAAPEPDELPARLEAVLEAIYAVYGQGWEDIADTASADTREQGFTDEAFWLARLLVQLLPDEPEAQGLLALLLYCESRRAARRSPSGDFVPLSRQDSALWSRPKIEEAERLLAQASSHRKLGRFQLEAAIQSAHTLRGLTGKTNWAAVAALYEGLVQIAPTLGGFVGQAAAVAEWRGPEAGLALLHDLAPGAVKSYQPFWAVKAHLLRLLNRTDEANHAFDLAIGLTEDSAVRQYLLAQR
ncbi:MAG: RNA polymerase subunit sigma-70 [Cytophagales bacterium]|nr:RNA polymerase subunit sigma-70 [Armatimonadota bacterium]